MAPKDLVALVADKNIDHGVRGLLARPKALGIREIEADLLIHQKRDPACLGDAHNFLRPFVNQYRHAIVMFDRQGSGREHMSAEHLSEEVRGRLAANGWGDRAEAVVLDPELEAWVFAASPNVERCLGWRRSARLRDWLVGRGLWNPARPKPTQPREALERALFEARRPRSASIYECLGRRVSFRECTDPAFLKFRATLVSWFPSGSSR